MEEIFLSLSPGGANNTSLTPWAGSFEDLADLLKTPTVGPKDGPYLVRGDTHGKPRKDENLSEAHLVIIDGDSRLVPSKLLAQGEVVIGAPPALDAHDALKSADIAHIIATTHSHGIRGNRWRCYIPVDKPFLKTELSALVGHVITLLHDAGVMVAPAKENLAWSQLWYLPRIRDDAAPFEFYQHDGGYRLNFDDVDLLAKHPEPEPEEHQQQPAPEGDEIDLAGLSAMGDPAPRSGIIGQVNAKFPPEKILELLGKHGYRVASQTSLNGSPCWRLLSPASTSGAAGVALFKSKAGVWRVVSHHGEHCRLALQKDGVVVALDAFDISTALEFNGDPKKALSEWRKRLDPRPVIKVFGGSLTDNTEDCIKAIANQKPPRLFQRGQVLTRVVHVPETVETDGIRYAKGCAVLSPVCVPDLRIHLQRAARFEKPRALPDGEIEWVPCDPAPQLAQSVLSLCGEWDGIPPMLALSEAPILRPDGSVVTVTGYDPITRLFHDGRCPELTLSASPDLAEAKRAAEYMLSPFKEFPFEHPKIDQSVLLAYLITLLLRALLRLAPLFGVSATAPGSGKGLLIEACNLLVRGRDAAIMSPPGGGQDAESETRKRITSILASGATSVCLDNVTTALGGESLNALLTASEWSDRILGQSVMVKLPTRVALAATGNNLHCRGDMVRRMLRLSIDPGVERPEQRSFQTDLIREVTTNRGMLLSALLTILRAYIAAGRPEDGGRTLGRFEGWSRAVAAPIRWLGFPDPTDSQEFLRSEDPEASKLGNLLSAWSSVIGRDSVTVQEIIVRATGGFAGTGEGETLRAACVEVAGDRGVINPRLFAWYLRSNTGRVVSGLRITPDRAYKTITKWQVSEARR